jgi:hypothetical protein
MGGLGDESMLYYAARNLSSDKDAFDWFFEAGNPWNIYFR